MTAVKNPKHSSEFILTASLFDTPLGSMVVLADEVALYLLQFVDSDYLDGEIAKLHIKIKAAITPGNTQPMDVVKAELKSYFEGALKIFKTPVHLLGTPFQKLVWSELLCVPYGQTRSYSDQARAIGKHRAYRAVANANGANQFAILIPCHRIINSNGNLGGYSAGVHRKKWLLGHEKKH